MVFDQCAVSGARRNIGLQRVEANDLQAGQEDEAAKADQKK
jgi:hypothetical protein